MQLPTQNQIKTVTDIRENTISVLNAAKKSNKPLVIMHRNSPQAVLLSIKRYNQLMDLLED